MTFDDAFEKLIGHEGGFVDHASDPGGATNFGISARSYPEENIRGMTLDRAKAIYLRDFWHPAGCERVPPEISFDLFDMAVNSGVRAAIVLLQRVVGEQQDGIIGPRTLAAADRMPSARLRGRFNGARLAFMTDLPAWRVFSRGWARRIAANLQEI